MESSQFTMKKFFEPAAKKSKALAAAGEGGHSGNINLETLSLNDSANNIASALVGSLRGQAATLALVIPPPPHFTLL